MPPVDMETIILAEEVARQNGGNSNHLKFYPVEALLGMLKLIDANLIEPFDDEPLTDGEGNLLPHRHRVRIYRR